MQSGRIGGQQSKLSSPTFPSMTFSNIPVFSLELCENKKKTNKQIQRFNCSSQLDVFNGLHSFFYKNVVFPSQAEYSYFSTDFRLRIFWYYS